MGTRSLTVMQDEEGEEIAVLYRQMDGYPSGHGQELADFLAPFAVVNGLPVFGDNARTANGADCLAAQIVAHFKEGAGGFYLCRAGTRDAGEEWIYTVQPRLVPKQGLNDDLGRAFARWRADPVWNDGNGESIHQIFRGYSAGTAIWMKVQAGDVTFFGLPGTKQANMPVLWQGWVGDFNAEVIEARRDELADTIPNDFLNSQKA